MSNPVLTVKRNKIFDTIQQAELPLCAQEINDALPDVNLATIYRGVKYLEEKRLIDGFTIVCEKDGIVRYYSKKQVPHCHYFHCTRCHRFFPFTDCSIHDRILLFEKEKSCRVNNHVLYLTGICEKCESPAPHSPL